MPDKTTGDVNPTSDDPATAGPRRPRLSLPRLVAGALDVARDLGADRMTMKDVATRLDVGTMSLYYYVPDKAALLAHMVGRLYEDVCVPDASEPWEDRLRSILDQVYRGFLAVPGLEPHIQLSEAALPSYARVAEAVLAALADGGVPRSETTQAGLVLLGYASDRGAATARRQQLWRAEPTSRVRIVTWFERSSYEHVRTSAAEAMEVAHEETFEYGLDMLLHGLRAHSLTAGS